MYEDVKSRLVAAEPGDFPRVQGEAQTYRRMINDLKRPKLGEQE